MKPMATETVGSSLVPEQGEEQSVLLPRNKRSRKVVTLEWRDGAGELHYHELSPELSMVWLS